MPFERVRFSVVITTDPVDVRKLDASTFISKVVVVGVVTSSLLHAFKERSTVAKIKFL